MIDKTDELRAALRQLPASEPRAELLERILESHAAGTRLALPTGDSVPLSWAVAATVAALLLSAWLFWPSNPAIHESRRLSRDPFTDLIRGTMIWPSAGVAQESQKEIPLPRYPLILSDSLDLSRLAAGVWTYRSETTTDDVFTDSAHAGGDRIRLTRATYAGRPAWMVNTARRFGGAGWTQYEDTTYLDAASLRPRHAEASGRKLRFEQAFTDDSVHESITRTGPMANSWRGAIAFPFPRNALFFNHWSPDRLSVLAPALPMSRTWRRSLYQVAFISWGWARNVAPLDLRVVGMERVTVPAGSFDCWRVEVEIHLWQAERMTMWVSRDKGWVVKQQSSGSDYVVNRVLESFEPLK